MNSNYRRGLYSEFGSMLSRKLHDVGNVLPGTLYSVELFTQVSCTRMGCRKSL